MAVKAHFSYKGDGLKVNFRSNTSTGVISTASFTWDFGDGKTSTDKNPEHTYNDSGFFDVKLTINQSSTDYTFERTIGASNIGQPLALPLYQLVDQYIPEGITLDPEDKEIRIQKWQLYLSPLVNHEIALDDIYDEFSYTALENTLIAQLIAYDLVVEGASKYLISQGKTNGQEIKKMVQGPMETEWFQGSETLSKIFAPGGTFDTLAQTICSLASRLTIYIPGICSKPATPVIPFIVSKIDTHDY